MSSIKYLAAAISCASLASTGVTAAESGGIQEVIVTAQKREESLQSTPIAISALSTEQLESRGITSFEGVAKTSPSITFTPYPNSSNLLILYMRGQGVSDPAQITSDGSVGLYEDGFYISRPQAATFDLADLERVEVLRGPQGTLYGRNTTGGAVNLISKKPSGEFGFKQNLTFGTRDQFRSLTTVDLPKWNDISTKFTVLKSSIDGYVKNIGSSHDFGEEAQLAGRFALHWDIAENFAADYFMEKGNLDSTPGYYQNEARNGSTMLVNGTAYTYHDNAQNPQSRTYRPFDLKLSTSSYESHGLTLSWDVNDALTLRSLTGYRTLGWHAYQDFAEAFTFVGLSTPPINFPVTFTSDNEVTDHQFSQELQAIGNVDQRLKYVVGLYYFGEGSSSDGIGRNAVPPIGSDQTTYRNVTADARSEAAYAQLTWTPPILDDRFDVTVGARYTRDKREATRALAITGTPPNSVEPGSSNSQNFSKFNPMLTLDYKWSDDLSTYAKVSTGYKAGGSSESAPLGAFDQTFDPEEIVSYELGLKSYWWDRRVRLNAAAFESKFDDMQLAFSVNPYDPSYVQAYNAGKATVRGFELDLLVMPIDDLSLSVDYSYLDPKLDEVKALQGTIFDPAVNPAVIGVHNVGDNIKDLFALPYAPRHSVTLAADYTFLHLASADLSAHLDYHFQSHIFATATAGPDVPGRDNVEIPSYGTLNGRLTLAVNLPRGDNVKVSLWGKNLTNKEYISQAVGTGSSVSVPSVIAPGALIDAGYIQSARIWGEPPSYGIDINYQY